MSRDAHRFRGASRAARGSVIGASCLVTTSALHALAGGSVGLIGLTIGLAIAWALGTVVADRRRSIAFLALVLLGGQALLHVVLAVGATHSDGHHAGAGLTPMLAAHLVACLVTAAALVCADDLVHCWLSFLRACRRRRPEIVALHPVAPCFAIGQPSTAVLDRPTLVVATRGPPSPEA